jgi:hypothetical protein
MCTYGIELLEDNIAECRVIMLETLVDYLNLEESDEFCRAAYYVLSQNIVHGDAMNQAVFAFRRYEDASLRYTGIESLRRYLKVTHGYFPKMTRPPDARARGRGRCLTESMWLLRAFT